MYVLYIYLYYSMTIKPQKQTDKNVTTTLSFPWSSSLLSLFFLAGCVIGIFMYINMHESIYKQFLFLLLFSVASFSSSRARRGPPQLGGLSQVVNTSILKNYVNINIRISVYLLKKVNMQPTSIPCYA